jgi:hypothetical protein
VDAVNETLNLAQTLTLRASGRKVNVVLSGYIDLDLLLLEFEKRYLVPMANYLAGHAH